MDKSVLLFKRCLGLNDDSAFATQKLDYSSGSVEFTDCSNITVTSDGAVQKIPSMSLVLTHSSPITNISAKHRFIYQDGVDIKEWDGSNIGTIGAIMDGPVAHTPIDVRVCVGSDVYKSTSIGNLLLKTSLGDLSNVPDRLVKSYSKQPAFKSAFEYNGFLYSINGEDNRFLQYSEYTHYDVFSLGTSFVGHTSPILQAGAIPGVMVCTHSNGISVYTGTNIGDFVKKFYPHKVLDNTLWSGYVGKTYRSKNGSRRFDYCHMLACEDGIYTIGPDGVPENLTPQNVTNIKSLNGSYSCSIVESSKYLVYGNSVALEYDFELNSTLKRSSTDIVSSTIWDNNAYYASGSDIVAHASDMGDDTTLAYMVLPFSNLGAIGNKTLHPFYFTGTMSGTVRFTVIDQNGLGWSVEESGIGRVSSYRIKTPKIRLGNHLSVRIDILSGSFRMEELRASISASQRTK